MIKYTPQNQLKFENFEHPFELALNAGNRWVKLAKRMPWDELARIYIRSLSQDYGRPSIDVRLAIGALIVKHRLKLSDREVVQTIQENIYVQYFVGFSSFNPKPAFDPSLFVEMRKRMGADKFDEMTVLIIQKAEGVEKSKPKKKQTKDESNKGRDARDVQGKKGEAQSVEQKQPKNKGTLKLDATVADQMIVYPTDLGLLNQGRLESERIIDLLYKHKRGELKIKPRTYRRKARAEYLSVAKKRKKTKREIRKHIGKQLRYLKRNLATIEKLLDLFEGGKFPLKYRDLKIYWVLQTLYGQQKYMYDNKVHSHPHRIVNIYQPYVRPIPRGKDKVSVEFGSKLGISEMNGFSRINHISWEAYNETTDLEGQVEDYRDLFGYYPELILVDQIYLSRKNRAWLKTKDIRHVGKPLGRPNPLSPYQKKKLKKERGQRNHVEGKIGQGKYAYGLNEIKARRSDTSESWIAAISFVMNLVRWLKIAPLILLLIAIWLQWFLFFTANTLQQTCRTATISLGEKINSSFDKIMARLIAKSNDDRNLALI